MVAHKKEVYYRLGIWHSHHITHKTNTTGDNCHGCVPVALEEFADDLDTETKEEVDNLELAKGNGMHEINHSKRNIICIYLILQFTSLIVSRKKLITAQITFLSARRLAPHSGPELAWCCVAGCDPRGGLDMSNLYNARARRKVFAGGRKKQIIYNTLLNGEMKILATNK